MNRFILSLIFLFSASVNAANPTANIIWSGFIPGNTAGNSIIITGIGGQPIDQGQLIVARDGTFTSTVITLEAHSYDPVTKVVGGLVNAAWHLNTAQVQYSSAPTTETALDISFLNYGFDISMIDGSGWFLDLPSIRVGASQNMPINVESGGSVQVQATFIVEDKT